ncbi:MAG: aspartate aminotransferase family protein [Clostridia bacterium]|nr:aspartate aminotransferase family protein [Clostridia bacterium]
MSIKEIDKQYIAGTYDRFPIEIVSGKGSLVYDDEGMEYIDMTSGIGVTSFGIADDEWKNAAIEQINKVQHMSNLYYTQPCAELAKTLCDRSGMKKVFFANSGAEANEGAIKAARKYAAEKHGEDCYTIVTLSNSFHGRTITTLSATGQEHYHEMYHPLTEGFRHTTVNDIYEFIALISKIKVAAVMIECIQGEGGVITLDYDFVKELREVTAQKDILLIVDEVQTGNGRTGKLYSYMNYDIVPDIVTTAKGLAGGLPIGAVLLGEKVKDVFGFGDHGSTFGGNPVCCSAALSVINRIDDKLLNSINEKSQYIKDELKSVNGVEEISGMGLMLGIKTVKPATEVVKICMDNGVLCLTAKDKVRLLPALNIDTDSLKKAVNVIKEACKV